MATKVTHSEGLLSPNRTSLDIEGPGFRGQPGRLGRCRKKTPALSLQHLNPFANQPAANIKAFAPAASTGLRLLQWPFPFQDMSDFHQFEL